MVAPIVWPWCFVPRTPAFNVRPFSRSGGPSLNGVQRSVKTDLGFWSATLGDIPIHTVARRRTWNAIRTGLGGRPGLVIVPAYERSVSPYVGGVRNWPVHVPHSDETTFSDDSDYQQRTIDIRMFTTAAIGATYVFLQIYSAAPDLAGVRFSYQHALYETGPFIAVGGSIWQVPISPAIRAAIPAGAHLEFEEPDCLMHLASDDAMDIDHPMGLPSNPTIQFVEATDYWSDLAS